MLPFLWWINILITDERHTIRLESRSLTTELNFTYCWRHRRHVTYLRNKNDNKHKFMSQGAGTHKAFSAGGEIWSYATDLLSQSAAENSIAISSWVELCALGLVVLLVMVCAWRREQEVDSFL